MLTFYPGRRYRCLPRPLLEMKPSLQFRLESESDLVLRTLMS
jgi:hypothetical protein